MPLNKLNYLLGFFVSLFYDMKHLAKGDLFLFSKYHMIVLTQWSKTTQMNNLVRLLKLPYINNDLCPAKALKTRLQMVPGSKISLLFPFGGI